MVLVQERATGTVRQTLHVIVTTYTEPLAMVCECVTRLLVAPEPLYCEKTVYVCDDGHAKPGGPDKREMVAQLHHMGTISFHVQQGVRMD